MLTSCPYALGKVRLPSKTGLKANSSILPPKIPKLLPYVQLVELIIFCSGNFFLQCSVFWEKIAQKGQFWRFLGPYPITTVYSELNLY